MLEAHVTFLKSVDCEGLKEKNNQILLLTKMKEIWAMNLIMCCVLNDRVSTILARPVLFHVKICTDVNIFSFFL